MRGLRCQSATHLLESNKYNDSLDKSQNLPIRSGSTNYLLDLDMEDEELDKMIEQANEENQKYKAYLES